MRRFVKPNNSASVGISAMIVFVALILVSAVISIVIGSIGQEIFEESNTDASKTDDIIYGKIFIISAVISAIELDGNNEPMHANILVSLELSPGASIVDDDMVKWTVLCPNEINPDVERWTNEGNLEAATTASGDGGDIGAIEELSVGTTYMINIHLQHTTDNVGGDGTMDSGGCPPNYLEVHTLIFAIGGTGSYTSWNLNYDESLDVGEVLI